MLRRATESARQALVHLEPGRIPASLRPVVRASGLTPHLEALLVREMEALPWLREKAAEQWGGAEAALAGDGPDRGSALFLLRPDLWAVELVRIAGEAGWGGGAAGGDKAAVALEKARAEITELREKVRGLNRESTERRNEVRRLEKAAAAPVRSEQADVSRLRQKHGAELEAMKVQRDARAAAGDELSGEVSRLREDLKRERRGRAQAEHKLQEGKTAPAWAKGSVELARLLDQVAAAAIRVIPEGESAAGTEPLRLARGVRPDSADAVDAVLQHSGPKHLLVDGYNVGLALASGKAAEVRSRLEPVLARLRALARPPRSVTVIYDSSLEGADGFMVQGVSGVSVRFTPKGMSADDLIVKMAGTPGTVVISNDREVRERSERGGALALWAEALVAWTRKRR